MAKYTLIATTTLVDNGKRTEINRLVTTVDKDYQGWYSEHRLRPANDGNLGSWVENKGVVERSKK